MLCIVCEKIMRVLIVTISLRLFFDRSKSSVVASLSNLSLFLICTIHKYIYLCCVVFNMYIVEDMRDLAYDL